MNDNRSVKDILKLSPEERKSLYQVNKTPNKDIDKVMIDGIEFTDYSAFSFLMAKSYLTSPSRSSDGSIPDLDTYPWFLTPQLKIDFSLLSIDSYRALMKLIRSKNEFTVTCYDIVEDANVTHKMYFAPEQMPKLWNITKALLNTDGKLDTWVELLGVQDYTIELVGTNNDVEEIFVRYHLNVPKDVTWLGDTVAYERTPITNTLKVGVSVKSHFATEEIVDVSTITFGNKYKFLYWAETSSGGGFHYTDGVEYMFTSDKRLYAIWEVGE